MKKIILMILIISLLFTTVGCGKSSLEEYNNALKKTSELEKGEMILEINVDNEFRESILHQQAVPFLKSLESIKLKQNIKTDLESQRALAEISASVGGFGVDFNMYVLGEKFYVEVLSPIISPKKYVEVEPGDVNFFSMQTFEEYEKNKGKNTIGLSDDTFEKIKNKWLEILEDENVFKGEKILITTEAGEVKAREYTISIDTEQLVELINFSLDTIRNSGEIEKGIEEGKIMEENELNNIYQLFDRLKEFVEDAKNLNFIYKAFIDIDGYIVEQKMSFLYESGTKYNNPIKKSEIDVFVQNLNIGKTPSFDMEEANEENTLKLEDLNVMEFPLFNQGVN